ncbi:Mariner Mos1 transposase [Acromyrmex echinatior]|uniref:Mariner Mos1 transposase n=1 Tax=Acromyrmex echinatior TaxID=103372 RepID=F4W9Y9_ACREC|nr:Mariner Mos1 transposase [Acromyrmex echinatior]
MYRSFTINAQFLIKNGGNLFILLIAPSDYHLFTKLKESLAGKRFQSDEEVQTAVTNWTKELAGSFYAEGISKLVSRYTKCIEIDGNYVEKD